MIFRQKNRKKIQVKMQSFYKIKSLRAHIFTVYVIYLLIVDKIKRKTVVWIVSVSLMSQRWSQNISVCRHLLVQHPHKLTGFERNFPCKNMLFFSWNYIVTSSLDMPRITVIVVVALCWLLRKTNQQHKLTIVKNTDVKTVWPNWYSSIFTTGKYNYCFCKKVSNLTYESYKCCMFWGERGYHLIKD
jgi:SNF family Na+-dependent transporter